MNIAVTVVGGTSLMRGRGTVIGAFAGILIVAILQNGLAHVGVSEPAKRLIPSGVTIVAVFLDSRRIRRGNATRFASLGWIARNSGSD